MSQIIVIKDFNPPQRLDHYLKKNYPHVAFSLLQKWMRTGQIRINGKRITGAIMIQMNDQLRLPPQMGMSDKSARTIIKPHINERTFATLRNSIIYENEFFLALNKPFGLATQGGTKIKDALSFYLNILCTNNSEPLRVVHRLDRDTTGALILAKTLSSSQILSQMIAQRMLHKYYLAILAGEIENGQGFIKLPIGKMTGALKEKMSSRAPFTSTASTQYHVIAKSNGLTYICFKPITGRTHQLRVHSMEGLGHPILGDGKYGGRSAYLNGHVERLHLHAWTLCFNLYGSDHQITTPLPPHFIATLKQAGFNLPHFNFISKVMAI